MNFKITFHHLSKIYKIYVISTLIAVFAIVLFFGGINLWGYKFSPTFPVLDLEISNLTDQSATVTWTTTTDMIGTVRFLGEKNLTRETNRSKSRVHSVTISGLKSFNSYNLYITNDFGRKIRTLSFKTLPTETNLKLPQTVYGKVLENGVPSDGAVVALRRIFLSKPQVQSATITSITNSSGNFLLDLSNALLIESKIPKGAVETLEIRVWTKNGKYKENLISTVQTQPVPDINVE